MSPKTLLAAAFLLSATSLSASARADEKAACLDATAKGQTLRDAHQLVEAREQLRICARQACPAVVQTDCVAWLDAVEKSLPTVVLTAKDRAGGDLIHVKVLVDGRLLMSALDGQAVPMNPGAHTFRFEAADGSSAEQQILVREGERARSVTVVLTAPVVVAPIAPTTVAPIAPAPVVVAPIAPAVRAPAPRTPSGLRTAGWVVGGLGVVGLGVGAVAGGLAIGDKSSAQCSASHLCAPGPLASARTAAKVSDAGFIAGGALLATGITLLLVSRSGGREAVLGAAPLVGAMGGAVTVRGSW